MKPTSLLRNFLFLASAVSVTFVSADTLYYDGGGTTSTGLGWGTNTVWSSDLAGTTDPAAAPVSTDDVIFSITGAADGVVGMNAARAANSLTFNSSAANTLMAHTTTTTANSLTIGTGGVTINSGAGAVTFGVSTRGILTTTLGASQSWTHDGANLFSITQAVSLGANTLTLAGGGTGGITIGGVVGGTGAVTVNRTGTGAVSLSGANTFSGQLTVARGTLSIGSINNVSASGTLGNSALGVILGSSGNTGTLSYTGGTTSSSKPFSLATGGTGVFDVSNAATSLTLGGAIGGSGGLTKTGSGRLILTSATNNYSGTTLVGEGYLRFGTNYNTSWNDGRLSANSNLEINGGIVEAYYYKTFVLGSGAGQLQITGGRSGFTNMQGDATANFVTFGTTGTTVTWGTSTFAPSTFVMNDVGASAVMRIANPFNLNGDVRTIEVSATGIGGGRGTYGILTGNLSGTGASLVKTGAGTLMLDGTNTYDGGTTINAGGVWFRDTAAMPATGTVTVNDGGILSVGVGSGLWTTGTSGNGTMGGLLGGVGGSGQTISYSGNVAVGFNISGTLAYSGNITNVTGSSSTAIHIGNKDSGSASDPFEFAGTLTLSGNNSHTGGTSINRGTLIAGSANALGATGDITFRGGTLQYTAAAAANDYGSRIKNSTAAISLNTNSQNVTLSGMTSGNTGGLTKSGAGTLTFTGTNTYSGATTLSAGSIAVYDGTLSTSGNVTFNASSTSINVTGGTGVSSTWNLGGQSITTTSGPVSGISMLIDGGGVAGSALVTNVGTLIWGRTANNSTISLTNGGQMSVNGQIQLGNPYYGTPTGGANITIGGGTATSTFTGNSAQAFYIGYGERENAKNNVVTVSSGGVLTGVGNMIVGHVNNTQGNDLASTGNKLTVTGTGTASMASITVGLAEAGSAALDDEVKANVVEVTSGGTLTTAGLSYIGRATVASSESNANTLTVTGTGSSWNAGGQNVIVGSTNNSTATSNNNILSVGAGASVTNVNVLTVGSGSGTETGNQLVVNGILSATTVTVSAGNTLSGSGTINGAVTVNGNLNPGTSPGLLTIGGSLALANSTTTTMEIAGTTLGLDYDAINATGNLLYDGILTLAIGTTFGSDAVFNLFDFGSQSGSFDSVALTGNYTGIFTNNLGVWEATTNSGNETWSFSQATGNLTLTVIPEPSTALLAALGMLALLRRRR